MPCGEQSGVGLAQRAKGLFLVRKQLQTNPRVQFRVIWTKSQQPAILVVLDQPMIGISWKRERAEIKGIDCRETENLQIGRYSMQLGEVERHQIVPQHEVGTHGKGFEFPQCGVEPSARIHQRSVGAVTPDGCEMVYSPRLPPNLQVDGDASLGEIRNSHRVRPKNGPETQEPRAPVKLPGGTATTGSIPSMKFVANCGTLRYRFDSSQERCFCL